MTTTRNERRAELRAAAFFSLSTLGAIALVASYVDDASARWQGLALLVALGGLALGLVTWANHLMPPGPYMEERHSLSSGAADADEATDTFEEGATIARRTLLVRSLLVAGAATGAAALLPLKSLGAGPDKKLSHTPWKSGLRAVTDDGRPVRAVDVPLEGLVTIFPEGHPGSADGQAVLIRLDSGLLAFSRVCTHAGCPVGLYTPESHELLCPCHQSAFDVLDGARVTFGPAGAPLPKLPIAVDADGFVIATGDFSAPVGPAFWHRS